MCVRLATGSVIGRLVRCVKAEIWPDTDADEVLLLGASVLGVIVPRPLGHRWHDSFGSLIGIFEVTKVVVGALERSFCVSKS